MDDIHLFEPMSVSHQSSSVAATSHVIAGVNKHLLGIEFAAGRTVHGRSGAPTETFFLVSVVIILLCVGTTTDG